MMYGSLFVYSPLCLLTLSCWDVACRLSSNVASLEIISKRKLPHLKSHLFPKGSLHPFDLPWHKCETLTLPYLDTTLQDHLRFKATQELAETLLGLHYTPSFSSVHSRHILPPPQGLMCTIHSNECSCMLISDFNFASLETHTMISILQNLRYDINPEPTSRQKRNVKNMIVIMNLLHRQLGDQRKQTRHKKR